MRALLLGLAKSIYYLLLDSNALASLSPLKLVITPKAVNWQEFNRQKTRYDAGECHVAHSA